MSMLNTMLYQSSMQEIDLLNPQLDPRITYTGGPKWYHGPDGLLRESPGNLLLWSNTFNNAVWSATSVTVVPDAIRVLGDLSMTRLVEGAATSQHRIWQGSAGAKAGTHTVQIKAKADTRSQLLLRLYEGATARAATYFDLSTGTVINTTAGTATITPLGEGVYLCTVTGTFVADATAFVYINTAVGGVGDYTGDGVSGIYIAEAQAEKGATASHYLNTTTAIVYNWPLEYDPITLLPMGRSSWESRTNLMTQSNAFNDATIWTVIQNTTVTPSFGVGPTGATGTFKLTPNTTSGAHYLRRATGTSTGTQTFSIYARAAGYRYLVLGLSSTSSYNACFDLVSGVVDTAPTTDIGTSGIFTASITPVGNGIYRCSYTQSFSTVLYVAPSDISTRVPNRTWAGDGTSGIEVFGVQQEAGVLASPYIPTTTSTVFRPQDNPRVFDVRSVRYNTNTSGLMVEAFMLDPAGGNVIAEFNNGGSTGRFGISSTAALAASCYTRGSTTGGDVSPGPSGLLSLNALHRVIAARSGLELDGVADGSSVSSDGTASVPLDISELRLGDGPFGGTELNGYLTRVWILPFRPVVSEMQAITA